MKLEEVNGKNEVIFGESTRNQNVTLQSYSCMVVPIVNNVLDVLKRNKLHNTLI